MNYTLPSERLFVGEAGRYKLGGVFFFLVFSGSKKKFQIFFVVSCFCWGWDLFIAVFSYKSPSQLIITSRHVHALRRDGWIVYVEREGKYINNEAPNPYVASSSSSSAHHATNPIPACCTEA